MTFIFNLSTHATTPNADAILHTQRRPPQLLLPWHQRDDPVVAERDSLVP